MKITMKTKTIPTLTRATLIATLIGVAPAFAANSMKSEHRQNRDTGSTTKQDASAAARDTYGSKVRLASEDPRGWRAGELLGREVFGTGDEELGNLHDLVVDVNTGKVAYAVVSSGGLLGMGDDLRAVPIEACRLSGDRVSIDINRTRWAQAPVYTRVQLRALNVSDRTTRIHEFFGSGQAGRDSDASAGSREQPRQFVLVSEIRGKDVRSGDQEIGEIDDVVVQPGSHRAVALLDADDDFVGDDRHYIVPLAKLNGFNTDTLTTNLGRQDFTRVGEFSEASWSVPVTYVSTLYVWPIDTVSGERDDRAAGRSTNTGSADGGSGQAPIAAIREAVRDETSNANADVRVITEEDKVVLRGTVPNEDLKDRIEERAEQIASGWEIDNQIRVAQNR